MMDYGRQSSARREAVIHGIQSCANSSILKPAIQSHSDPQTSQKLEILNIKGNIVNLEVKVQAIVNPWNWSRLPLFFQNSGGASGSIKNACGYFDLFYDPEPFRELSKWGRLKPAESACTGAGKLSSRGIELIFHVATMGLLSLKSDPAIVEAGIKNVLDHAQRLGVTKIATPILCAGHGGMKLETAREAMTRGILASSYKGKVYIVEFDGSGVNFIDSLGSTVAFLIRSPFSAIRKAARKLSRKDQN